LLFHALDSSLDFQSSPRRFLVRLHFFVRPMFCGGLRIHPTMTILPYSSFLTAPDPLASNYISISWSLA
jgi:hypothetical protein